MVNYKMVADVHKRKKQSTKILQIVMIVLGVLFLFMGIAFSRGFMLPCFLMAGLYFVFQTNAEMDYEYIYEDDVLTVDIIKGKRKRIRVKELKMERLEVLAPHAHEAVAQYRKDGGSIHLKKYDYTSYDDSIPYYTMIITDGNNEKIKLLLDLTEEMLLAMKQKYPQKVYL